MGEVDNVIDTRPILRSFLQKREIVRQHLDSFNDFVENRLQSIINEIGRVETDVGIDIEFGKIKVDNAVVVEADGSKNRILPREARLRNLNYFSPITLEMRLAQEWKEGKWKPVQIGMLPTMVKSKICNLYGMNEKELVEAGEDPLDPGGYFIVNGSERVLVIIEDLAPNKIML